MDRVNVTTYKGKLVVHLDFSHCDHALALQVAQAAKHEIAQHPPASLRTVTDISGSPFDDDIVAALKDLAKHNKPYVVAGAIVGVSGIKRVILQAVEKFSGRTFTVCNSIEEAQDWVVAH